MEVKTMIKSKWLYPAEMFFLLVIATSISANDGSVTRAQFTTDIVDREPVDEITSLDADVKTVYYFTELKDMGGQFVTHRWIFNGDKIYEKAFEVDGDRWRVFTSKNLIDERQGEWRAEVVNADGAVLQSNTLMYGTHGSGGQSETRSQEPSAEEPAEGDDPEPSGAKPDSDTASAAEPKKPEMTPASEHVKRAIVTSEVADREPVDDLTVVESPIDKIFFFTEIVDFEGNAVSHRWIFKGETKAEVGPWQIEHSRYRTSSSKNMSSAGIGKWTIQVVDGDDNVLAEKSFEYR
jgi:hypothetical protein